MGRTCCSSRSLASGMYPKHRSCVGNSLICAQACQVMYTELLKAADAVPMTGGPGGPPITPSRQIVKGSKKTAAKEGDDAAVPTKKRTRKPKVSSAAIVNDAEDDDEGDNIAKKAKTEVKTEFKTEEDGGGEYDADAPFDLEEMV